MWRKLPSANSLMSTMSMETSPLSTARATTGVFRKLSKLSGKMVKTVIFMGTLLSSVVLPFILSAGRTECKKKLPTLCRAGSCFLSVR